jgi:ribonucleoside-diphosphate reductase alpha chain
MRLDVSYACNGAGEVREIFISGPKAGSGMEAMANDAAIVASLALQHGVPLSALCASVGMMETGQSTSLLGHALRAVAIRVGLEL